MYQMIYRISINLYRYEYRIKKTDRYPALPSHHPTTPACLGKNIRNTRWLSTGKTEDAIGESESTVLICFCQQTTQIKINVETQTINRAYQKRVPIKPLTQDQLGTW